MEELYFSPLACSMATRIAFYEAGVDAAYTRVDTRSKRLPDGADFLRLNPMGQVPVLRTPDGDLLTENAAVLQYVAERYPAASPGGRDPAGRRRLQQWLSFIGTELHKTVFIPLLDPESPEGAKTYALAKSASRLAYLDRHLASREWLLDMFSVADAYLLTVLNWAQWLKFDLGQWPHLHDYLRRASARPSVSSALAHERALFAERQAPPPRTAS